MKIKKVLSVLIIMCMIVSMLPMVALAADGTTWDGTAYAFDTTTGVGDTEATPFIIDTAGKLAYLAQQVNAGTSYEGKYFKLTADLDLNSSSNQWIPIGSYSETDVAINKPFKGFFDGNGKIISNLTISDTTKSYKGLFGYVLGNATTGVLATKGIIKNLMLANVNISVDRNSGGLVGEIDDGTITGCGINSGTINGTYSAGIVGRVYRSNITQCYNMASVSGRYNGGIAAFGAYDGFISLCYNTGSIKGPDSGGIAYSAKSIKHCYNTGHIDGSDSGGISGNSYPVESCYNTGLVDLGSGISNSIFTDCTIKNNVFLGQQPSNAFRIVHTKSGGILQNNYAWDGLRVQSYTNRPIEKTTDGFDGADISKSAVTTAFWVGLGFTTENGWTLPTGETGVPTLTGVGTAVQTSTLPKHMDASITIASQPTKLSYNNGDLLDLSGLKVNVVYPDGTTDTNLPYDYNVFYNKGLFVAYTDTKVSASGYDGKGLTVTMMGTNIFATTDPLTVAKTVVTESDITFPTTAGITYGSRLYYSVLTDGTAKVGSTTIGDYAWNYTDSYSIRPTVSNGGYEVKLSPDYYVGGNYDFTGLSGWNAETQTVVRTIPVAVTPKPITAAITPQNKTYDGTATATIGSASFSGMVGSDVISITGGTLVFNNKDVGTYKTVSIPTGAVFTLTGAAAGNYTLSGTPTVNSANITRKTLTVTPNDSQSKYVGQSDPALTYSFSGEIEGETPAFTGALTRVNGGTTGSYAIQQGTLALTNDVTSGFLASNYTLAFTSGKNFTISAVPVAPTITTTSLSNGKAGTPYSQTLAATGDVPITWSIVGGSLPAGLNLSAGGVISGIPTAAGTFDFTVKAANTTGSDTQALSITALVPVTDITNVPSTATAGTNLTLSSTVAPSNATNKDIVWSVKTAGNTGASISGNTLSTTAAGTVTVTATIANGTSVGTNYTKDFNITVNAPTYTVSATTNAVQANGVIATATFGTPQYAAGTTATVIITLSGTATGTGTHTVGLTSLKAGTITAPINITKAVTAGATPTDVFIFTFNMPANAVNDLVVTHSFVQAQSTVPTVSATTVAKTAATLAEVDFTLTSSLTGSWKVYDAQTGGNLVSEVTASASGTTLSLTHASNIPANTYYVSLTEEGKTGSTRLALTVGEYIASTYTMTASALTAFASQTVGYATAPTAQTVTITNTGNQIITLAQPTITNAPSNYNIGALSSTILAVGGTATFTVQPKTSLAVGIYTENINIAGSNSAATSVSAQFSVAVAFVPVTNITNVPTTATAGTNLTLSGTVVPNDATNKDIVWSVKTAGGTGASISGNTLSTTAAGTVTVTATIANGTAVGTNYTKDFDITVNALTYTVSATTNAVQANGVIATATVGTPQYAAGTTATVTITLSGTAAATGTHTVGLTSLKAGTIIAPINITKAVTAGATPTDTFAFTFTMPANAVNDLVVIHTFLQAQSTAPTASVTTVAKTAATQAEVDFTLTSSRSGSWKVYDAHTGGNIVSGVTASASGTTLSLTHASNIQATTYYVSVTEAGKAESTRLALTVGEYIAPTYTMTSSTLTAFASQTVGYATAPAAQTVTIANTGNQVITLTEPSTTNSSGNYNIGALSTTTLAVGGTATFTVQPKTGLAAGTYTENINIVGSNNSATSVSAQFSVAVAFVTVTNITNVPTTATAGTNLTLSGTVAPNNATNEDIVWSVKTAGNTGASISGNTLSTTAAGTVTVTATIANGVAVGTNYTKDFDITLNTPTAQTYAVSATTNAVQANGVTATATFGSSSYAAGATATVTITLSSSAIEVGTHTVGLTSTEAGTITAPAVVTKPVTAAEILEDTFAFTFTMPANVVDDLVVTHSFVQAQSTGQSTAPTSSAITVVKTAATQASVNFTLNSALTGTWKVYDAQTNGSIVSNVTASAIGITLRLTHASDIPANTYYVSVTEEGKTESTRLALTVGAYIEPTYTYTMSASSLNAFASHTFGYATAPVAQTVTITNTGNQVITLTEPATTNSSSNYNIGALSSTTLAVGGTVTFTVQPKTGLTAGIYTENINIVGSNNAATSVSAQFSVAAANNTGGGSSTAQTVTPIKDNEIDIIFNNDAQKAATAKVEEKNNIKTTTVTLDDAVVKENLDKMDKADPNGNDKKVIIPVNNNSDVIVGELNGQTVKNMADKKAVLEIKTENVSYTLPAVDINIDAVLSQMGKQVELKDIKVSVRIAEASSQTAAIVEEFAKKSSYTVVAKPVEFEITCTSGNKTVNVAKFNNYVERKVAIPDGIDPNKITTGVVLNSDGTFSHVPTAIVVIEGKYYAKINSLTNSTYTVIWNPITFKDVETHWAKDYVNDIGSRLIDSGVGNGDFAPNRAITRAEFASMIVKALGLKGTDFSDKFSDVKNSEPYYKAIYTAYEYGIIAGYTNGKFGTQDLITRQQAMIMISKAMKIAGIDESILETEISSQLNRFKDSGDISSSSELAAAICIKYGIFGGNKGMLTPKGNITRAESATIIVKLLKKSGLI